MENKLQILVKESGLEPAKGKMLLDMLKKLKNSDMSIKLFKLSSRAGGGSLPLLELPSICVGIKINGMSVNAVEKYMRETHPL